MEMEMEVQDEMVSAGAMLERLSAAAAALEHAAERLATVELEASLERVSVRETELEQRLAVAEATIETLKAEAAAGKSAGAVRRTAAAGVAMVAKEGVAVEAGALDSALSSLSIEQRIAVKAQMMRSGLLG